MHTLLGMKPGDVIGYAAAVLVFATFWMKTMIPLRSLGLASNVLFIGYGYLAGAYPPLVLHLLLLPLNIMRLHQMLQLNRDVARAGAGDLNMDWLKPFTSAQAMTAGELLFRKGEPADRMFFVMSGRCLLVESGIDLAPGAVVGELAILSPDKTRTQTLQCTEGGKLLEVSYSQLRQLYFQNPKFGFYFLELISKRLFENIARLEAEIAMLRGFTVPQDQKSS
jgi:CRP/FNR family transcriptional regulator, cyclic AMP receptor protein